MYLGFSLKHRGIEAYNCYVELDSKRAINYSVSHIDIEHN